MGESEEQIKKPKSRAIKAEFIVATAAILISLATLGVYIYQAQIMQGQQHTSVWPYLEWTVGYSNIEGLNLTVTNKGVGPAIVKNTTLMLDGKIISSPYDLMQELTNHKLDTLWWYEDTVDKRVLAPGEAIKLFHVKGDLMSKINFRNVYKRIKFQICYCSIYGECWISTGMDVKEGSCR